MIRKLSEGELQSIRVRAVAYIEAQFTTMERYGCARPKLNDAEYEKLIKDCSKPAIDIAKRTAKRS